eukprot:15357672-Ditylum_brightwellii.AAC.1
MSSTPKTIRYNGYSYTKKNSLKHKTSYYCTHKVACGCNAKIYLWRDGNRIECPPTNVHTQSCKLKNVGKPANDVGFMDTEVAEISVPDITEFMKITTDDLASENLNTTADAIWRKVVTSAKDHVGSNTWKGLDQAQ